MNENLIDATILVDAIDRSTCDGQADKLMGKIREQLGRHMPDEIGSVWPAIERQVTSNIESALEDHFVGIVAAIVEGATQKILDGGDAVPISDLVDCTDVNGSDMAELVSQSNTASRAAFLRAFVGRLSPMALEDLNAELLRS